MAAAAEGTRASAWTLVLPLILSSQSVYAAAVPRISFAARFEQNSQLPTHFQDVSKCHRVNAALFANAGRTPLIPNMFTRVNARYLYSYPAGVSCRSVNPVRAEGEHRTGRM